MAKENTPKEKSEPSASPKAKKKKKKQGGFQQKLSDFIEFIRSDQGRKIIAIFVIAASLALFVSVLSHFFTGRQDQSIVEGQGMIANPDIERPSNWLGSFGAWLANLFVTRGFGVLALLIPIVTSLFGFALLENNYYNFLWRLFGYSIFVVLWGSCALGFLNHVLSGSPGDLSGGFGWFMNEFFFNIIGKPGMGFLLTAVLLIFLVINFNTEFPISKWFFSLFPFFAAKPPKTEESTEEGLLINEGESKEAVIESGPVGGGDFVEEEISLEMEINTPEDKGEGEGEEEGNEKPLEIIELPEEEIKTGDDLELVIADNANADLPIDNGEEKILDNIIKTDEEKYEKLIPDEDQESLEDDEILAAEWEKYDPTKELSSYQFPPIDLLKAYDSQQSKEVNRQELEENKNKIVRTLKHYNIEIVSIKATIGPTVTLYEIVPAPGVRISRIKGLEDDIALSLAALGIRIIAPIPGKGTIGIEIPNSNPEIVSMRSVLATEKFKESRAGLPIAIGKTISNEVYIADLTKMPHMLVAGATGQGKSVGINGLITSILYKKHPSQVKFVLIDPKKVELSLYSALEKHFLAMLPGAEEPIITDTRQVVHVLHSLCMEMDDRYDLLKRAKVRNISEYNEKFLNRKLNPRKGHRFLPFIVLIIDEFADLMMTAGKEIETPIARLAQLARAIGIHLVLATQRPSVNVITGIIKANFPARVSFRVTSKVDSRTILDTGGADQLIGRGDLLFSLGGDVTRIQNAFIDTPEVEQLVAFIAAQRGFSQAYLLPEPPVESEDGDDDDMDPSERDSMFNEAARLVVRHQQGSTSLIQRRLKLGYNRAGRIIDQLERAGIVGPFSGSKAREVMVQDESELERILSTAI